jgi:Uma2 family endonuclease
VTRIGAPHDSSSTAYRSKLAPADDGSFANHRHPQHDTLLVIDVSDTTLAHDLRRKMALYARQGIKEYWVVDLVNRRLHVFRSRADAGYEQASSIDRPGALEITALPGTSVDLSSLFDQEPV